MKLRIALLLLMQGPGDPVTPALLPTAEDEGPYTLSVEATSDQNLAVFRTNDPKIHVVWLYGPNDAEENR